MVYTLDKEGDVVLSLLHTKTSGKKEVTDRITDQVLPKSYFYATFLLYIPIM